MTTHAAPVDLASITPRLSTPAPETSVQEGVFTPEGPWTTAFGFDVALELRSKSNHRRYTKGKGGRDEWKALQDFEQNLGLLARSARPAGWPLGLREDALPQRPKVVSFVFARSTLDAANLSKSVLDACEGIVYHNDASVRYCGTLGLRTRSSMGGMVAFAALAPEAGLRTVMEAAWALEAACLLRLEGETTE